ncbi:MAG TPA: hypothetical protein VHG92_00465 [Afifellaceae bacterium]|nr:hypothetical protein [Afifellaceae bacterium]
MPFNKTITAGLVALSALVAAAPAHANSTGGTQAGFSIQFGTAGPAQYRGHHNRWSRLSPRQVEWALQRQGFHRVRITGAHGPVYRAIAVSPRGGRVALTVSASNGRILDVDRIGQRHRGGWDDRGRRGRGGRGYH